MQAIAAVQAPFVSRGDNSGTHALELKLWQQAAQVDRSVLPTAGQMISDQTGLHVAPETREEMERRYEKDL